MKIIFRIAFIGVLVFLGGCGTQISLDTVSARERINYGNIQTPDNLRRETMNFLGNHLLQDKFDDAPETLVLELERIFRTEPRAEVLGVLADVCLAQGLRASDKDMAARFHLTALAYSYAYLLAADHPEKEPYNPERIQMMRIYNTALIEFISYLKKRDLLGLSDYQFQMIAGQQIRFRPPQFQMDLARENLQSLELCADFRPRNLTHISYRFGLGATLIGQTHGLDAHSTVFHKYFPAMVLPGTAVLRFERSAERRDLLYAEFSFYNTRRYENVTLNGRKTFPLELDFSTPLAYMSRTPLKLNNLLYMLRPDEAGQMEGLYWMEPYREDRIPVVLVHGLMSHTRTWLQMLNTLQSDPVLRNYYQFWGFTYSSGNPVLFSAKSLRDALGGVRGELLAAGKDDRMFNRMVVIGHSMGGLLSKTLIQEAGNAFADRLFNVPLETVLAELTPEQRTFVGDMVSFKPQPYVKRVVFMAVPHRGSLLSRSRIARLGIWLIRFPNRLVDHVQSVARVAAEKLQLKEPGPVHLKTGIGNLDPNDMVLKILESLPYAPDVPRHSIIGNDDEGGIPGGSDGIVDYSSSHLDGVVSELVVKSGHSVQQNPLAIQEIRRILLEHLKQYPDIRLPASDVSDLNGEPLSNTKKEKP